MPTKKGKVKALAIEDKAGKLHLALDRLLDNQKACEVAFAQQPAFFDACRKQAAKVFEQEVCDVLSA